METIKLKERKHKYKNGDVCEYREPNVTESCFLEVKGKVVGFYLSEIPDRLKQLIGIANLELRSKRVPKSVMGRASGQKTGSNVVQYSTIIGSVPPRPFNKRPYPGISSVHGVESAKTFIKAMKMAGQEGERIIKELMPDQYERQVELIDKNVPDKFKFGKLFTSSISNFNISAPYHTDKLNIKGTVNIIITKRSNSIGGDLHVPDYDATFDCKENSMIVYPAWLSMHGVTPIRETGKDGYRNSLVFYPLGSFKKYK